MKNKDSRPELLIGEAVVRLLCDGVTYIVEHGVKGQAMERYRLMPGDQITLHHKVELPRLEWKQLNGDAD